MSSSPQREDSFSYKLLLQKSSHACSENWRSSVGDASTAEPDASSAVSIAESGLIAPTRDSVTLLRNVSPHDPNVDAKMTDLIRQTRLLSERVFDEDCLLEVTKKSGWKVSLLTTNDMSILCGFIVSRITKGALSIAKIAVPVEFRGMGLGKLIMEEMIKAAKKQGDVYDVCLSSLSTAVTFYQRLGFKAFTGMKIKTDKEVVEGQVYMEKKLRPRRR
mmetsp:Transcript_87051/g.186587  ORF Transcript_87051/g.186587 Transcript_87051/m.186587 type:complete len:218 (-) Transcript_87051:211-864(-)